MRKRKDSTSDEGADSFAALEAGDSPRHHSRTQQKDCRRRRRAFAACLALCALWPALLSWRLVFAYDFAVADCARRVPPNAAATVARMALLADPQLVDAAERGVLLAAWSDLHVRKTVRRLHRTFRPHALAVLGDVHDAGRFASASEDWDRLLARFHAAVPRAPPRAVRPGAEYALIAACGNHDVSRPAPDDTLRLAERFAASFGPLHGVSAVGAFDVVRLCTPLLMQRNGAEMREAVLAFARHFAAVFNGSSSSRPRVLLSHVPLWRPKGTLCVPEGGVIDEARGGGSSAPYWTTLDRQSSEALLAAVAPVAVFSGDSHSPCTVVHDPSGVVEHTVLTSSILGGTFVSGFALATLDNSAPQKVSVATCAMPSMYVSIVLYAAAGLATVLVYAWIRWRSSAELAPWAMLTFSLSFATTVGCWIFESR